MSNNSNKFTPHNWDIDTEPGTLSKYRLYSTETGKNIMWLDADEESKEEAEANIRLIANSPILLDALKRMVNLWDSTAKVFPLLYEESDYINAIIAIGKATK